MAGFDYYFFHPNIPTTQHTTLSKLCCFRRSQILVYSMMWYSLYRYIQYSYGVGRQVYTMQAKCALELKSCVYTQAAKVRSRQRCNDFFLQCVVVVKNTLLLHNTYQLKNLSSVLTNEMCFNIQVKNLEGTLFWIKYRQSHLGENLKKLTLYEFNAS